MNGTRTLYRRIELTIETSQNAVSPSLTNEKGIVIIRSGSQMSLTVLEVQTLHGILHGPNPPPLFRKLSSAEWALFENAVTGSASFTVPAAPSPLPPSFQLTGPSNTGSNSNPRIETDSTDMHRQDSGSGSESSGATTPLEPVGPISSSGTFVSHHGGLTLVAAATRQQRWDAGLPAEEKAVRKAEMAAEQAAKKAATQARKVRRS